MRTSTLIFGMDGTVVGSMPFDAKSWAEFTGCHGIVMEADEVLRHRTGSSGPECKQKLFARQLADREASKLVAEKNDIYCKLLTPVFAEVWGSRAFAVQAAKRGPKLALGTARDRSNSSSVMEGLGMQPTPVAVVGGDHGLRNQRRSFSKPCARLGGRSAVYRRSRTHRWGGSGAPRRHVGGGRLHRPCATALADRMWCRRSATIKKQITTFLETPDA